MAEAFDPYYEWLGISPKDQPPHHYRLLGIDLFEPGAPRVIERAADRQMVHLKQCATGEYAALSQRLLNEVSAARVCLLDAQQKAKYDADLRARLTPPAATAPVPAAPRPVNLAAKELRTRRTSPTPVPVAAPMTAPTAAASPAAQARKPQPKGLPVLPLALGAGALLLAGAIVFVVARGGGRPAPQNVADRGDAQQDENKTPTKLPDVTPPVVPPRVPAPMPEAPQPEPRKPEVPEPATPAATVAPTVEPTDDEAADPGEDDGDSGAGTADRLVIHNSHNGDIANAGARKMDVQLLRDGAAIWSKRGVSIPWAPDKDEKVALDLPRGRQFDMVRIEFPEWEPPLPSLAEVEVWSGTENLARKGRATASSAWQDRPQYAADKLVDGITSSRIAGTGYWLPTEAPEAWVEIALPVSTKPQPNSPGRETPEEDATEAETKPLRVAAPEEPERQRATREMRELYGQQIRALRASADKAKLAATLLGLGRETEAAELRFVLLSEAARLAGEAADIKLAFEAADEIGRNFTGDLWPLKVEALRVGARSATTKEQQAAVAQAASDVAKEAFDARQFEVALAVAKIAEGLLRQAGAAAPLQQVRAFATEVRAEKLRAERQTAEQAKKQAATNAAEEANARSILARGAQLVLTFDEPTLGRLADRIVVRDLCGSSQRGVVHGAALRPGVAGDALHFDGQDDYVDITPFALNLQDYAVSVWVRGKGTILGTGQNAEWPMFWHLHTAGFVHHIEPFRGGGREYDAATARDSLANEPLPADRWSHVAVCRGGTVMRLFIDGKLATENAGYHTQPFVTHRNWGMFVGMIKTWGGGQPRISRFEGLVDEVAIFDRALGEAEVAALHQLGKDRLSLLSGPLERGSAGDSAQ